MKKKCEGDAGGLPASEYNGTEELPDWLEGRKAMGRCPEEENNCTRGGQSARQYDEDFISSRARFRRGECQPSISLDLTSESLVRSR